MVSVSPIRSTVVYTWTIGTHLPDRTAKLLERGPHAFRARFFRTWPFRWPARGKSPNRVSERTVAGSAA
jgi:hypothetical protein